jgi:hypothetical protein
MATIKMAERLGEWKIKQIGLRMREEDAKQALVVLLASAIALPYNVVVRRPDRVPTFGALSFLVCEVMCHHTYYSCVKGVSTHERKKRQSPFQFRLDPELRKAMEEAQRQDGDESLAAWIKRVIRKELKQKGIEV